MSTVVMQSGGEGFPAGMEKHAGAGAWGAYVHVGVPGGSLLWPATDVHETQDSFAIRLEVAGLAEKQVGLGYLDGKLVIAGKRSESCNHAKRSVVQMEIPYGNFRRVIKLPAPIKLNGAIAHYTDGFLEILIPKAARTPRRKIYIRVNW